MPALPQSSGSAGARVVRGTHSASVWPVERLRPLEIEVPGDFSSAAPFLVAGEEEAQRAAAILETQGYGVVVAPVLEEGGEE